VKLELQELSELEFLVELSRSAGPGGGDEAYCVHTLRKPTTTPTKIALLFRSGINSYQTVCV
jgi:hypothetical protein